jgi:hypothetical protein
LKEAEIKVFQMLPEFVLVDSEAENEINRINTNSKSKKNSNCPILVKEGVKKVARIILL